MIKRMLPIHQHFPLSQELAAQFTHQLSRFESSILIHDGNKTINAKSLLGVLSLVGLESDKVEFIIDGTDEAEALKSLEAYFHR